MSYFISPGPDSSLGDVYYFHMLRLGGPDLSVSWKPAALPGLAMWRATPVGHSWNYMKLQLSLNGT